MLVDVCSVSIDVNYLLSIVFCVYYLLLVHELAVSVCVLNALVGLVRLPGS